jgi:hypothetical protein
MATRKQEPKPARKPASKPASRPLPTTTKPSSLDLVRNPNFDSAMAQKNYANFMADQQARLASQRGQRNAEDIYNQFNEVAGGLGRLTRDQNAQNIQGQFNEVAGGLGELTDPQAGFRQAGLAAKQGRQNAEDIYNQFNEVASGINELMPAQPQQAPQPIQTIAGPRPAVQMNPQKMQAFQNFLQQGIQRSNTMNQAPAAGFANAAAGLANLQPGMQPTQPAMPVAGMGMGMQQPRQAPAPRKFSIANNPSAKAF